MKRTSERKILVCVLLWIFLFQLTYSALASYTQQHTFVSGETLTHTYLNNEFQELQTQWTSLVETTGAQTIHGVKTFTSIPILPATQPSSNTQAMRLESVAYLMRGKLSGLEITYKDADETYLSSGVIHINDGSNDVLYYSNAQITAQLTGAAASTLYYIYVDPPASGQSLLAADIEYSTSAPTWNATYHGYYHPTSTDQKCIGAVLTDGSSNITEFIPSGDYVAYADARCDMALTDIDLTWTDVTLKIPGFCNSANITVQTYATNNADLQVNVRQNGQSGASGFVITTTRATAAATQTAGSLQVFTDTSQKIEIVHNQNNSDQSRLYTNGWYYPVGIRRN